MDAEEKELLRKHTQQMAEMQNDFQTFYKIVKHLVPEIEHTKTLTRLEKEHQDSMKKIKIKFQWRNETNANTSVCSIRNAPGMMEGAATSEHGACQTFCAMGILK